MAGLKFLEEEVPTPEDFPPASVTPGLRELDEAMRCNICKETYTAPVTISCGHCFCSVCIRQELPQLSKSECPICRQPTNESHIRKNTRLEEAVRAWNLARSFILELLEEEERRRSQQHPKEHQERETKPSHAKPFSAAPAPVVTAAVTSSYFKSPQKPGSSTVDTGDGKKRRRDITPDDDEVVEVSSADVILAGSGGRRGKQPVKKLARHSSPSPGTSGSSTPEQPDCPMCGKTVPLKTINQHIDSGCTQYRSSGDSAKQKQAWNGLFANAQSEPGPVSKGKVKSRSKEDVPDEDAKPIPKVSYDTIKSKRLKEMLQEHALWTTGDREQWVFRHQRWVIIYNANLDASERKSIDQLKKELASWEKTRQSKKPIVLDSKTYQKDNKATFDKLIASAKASARRSRSSPPESTVTKIRSLGPGGSAGCVAHERRSSGASHHSSTPGGSEIMVVD